MYIFSAFQHPHLWSQFLSKGLFFIILLIIQIVVLIFAATKRNPYTWLFLYSMEIAVLLITFRICMEGGTSGEVASVAIWLYYVMMLITVTTHLLKANRKWAVAYVLECGVLLVSILGLSDGKFVAVGMTIGFTGLLIGTVITHQNLIRHK